MVQIAVHVCSMKATCRSFLQGLELYSRVMWPWIRLLVQHKEDVVCSYKLLWGYSHRNEVSRLTCFERVLLVEWSEWRAWKAWG